MKAFTVCAAVLVAALCLGLVQPASSASADHGAGFKRGLHQKVSAALKVTAKKLEVTQTVSDELFMCRTILVTLFPAQNFNLNALSDKQASACWCLWSMTTQVSALTRAIFRFYEVSTRAMDTLAKTAKAFLKAAGKAFKDLRKNDPGVNLIGIAGVQARTLTFSTMCVRDRMDDGCEDILKACSLFKCLNAPDGSKWFENTVGQCERKNAVGIGCAGGCKVKSDQRCPTGTDTQCRCEDKLVDSCVCATKLPVDVDKYTRMCRSTGTLT